MFESGLDNELTASTTGLESSVMAAEQAEQEEQYVPVGYSTDQDGNFVNDNNERVYYWVPSSELGDGPIGGSSPENAQRELYKDSGGYYTEAEIRSAWDADQGMGYLKEQIDWNNYWGYLTERQGLIQDGTIYDATGAEAAGRQNRQDFLEANGGLQAMGGAKEGVGAMAQLRAEGYSNYYEGFLAQPEQMALMSKYGISPIIQNKDGDAFGWNGSSYTKIVKVDDHNYGAVVGQLIKSFVVSALTAGVGAAAMGYLATVPGNIGRVFNALNSFIFTAPAGGGPSIAQQVQAGMSNNRIINFVDDMLDVTDNPNGIEQENGTTRYTVFGPLPEGYIWNEAVGAVIHEETGKKYYPDVSPWGALVDLPDPEDEDDDSDAGGGGATAGEDASNSTTPTTDTSSDTSGSSGGSPTGSNPNNWPVLTGPSGDVPINDNPDIWSDEDGYAGWVIVSGTGVWGQSGVWVIRNPNTGQTQEVDWDNGTYSNPWENNPNNNDTDTDGNNQGEGQGDDTESTASGPATGPTTEAPPAEETVDYPDDGSACWLSDGTIGAKKSGQCVPTSDPFNDIIGWPYALPSEPYKPDTPPVDPADPSADTSSGSATTSGGSTDNNGGTDSNGTAGEGGSNTGGENGTGENGNNGPGDEGDGTGDGGNGNDGNGPSNPNQFIDGSGGISKATWSPLYRGTKFVPRRKGGGGMMSAMQSPNFTATDYTQQRQGLLSQAWKDLA